MERRARSIVIRTNGVASRAPEYFFVNRQTRKQLKTDQLAEGFGETFSFLSHHRAESIRYGLIALAVIVLAGGYYLYSRHQASVREDLLTQALKINDAIIGPADTQTNKAFPNQQAKDNATIKAWTDLYTKYHGTTEGSIAGLYLAALQADKAKFADAEKIYQDVVDSAPKLYAAQAEMSLAQIYAAEGKTDAAQKILEDRIAHPTVLVSSDDAKLQLADLLINKDSARARKLAEPLRNSKDVAVSKEAINVVGKINMATGKQQ